MKEYIGLGPTFGFGGPIDLNDAVPGVSRPRRAAVSVTTFQPKAYLAQALYLRPEPANANVRTFEPTADLVARIASRPGQSDLKVRTFEPRVALIENLSFRPAPANLDARTFQPLVKITGAVEARPAYSIARVFAFVPKALAAQSVIARPATTTNRVVTHQPTVTIDDAINLRPAPATVRVIGHQPKSGIIQKIDARPAPATGRVVGHQPIVTARQPDVPIVTPTETLATGLAGVADYSPQFAFRDIMKMSRPWIENWGGDPQTAVDNGHVGADGWPRSIPLSGQLRTIWAFPVGALPYFDQTSWTIRWEGNGSITMGGDAVNVVIDSANKTATFTLSGYAGGDTTFWLDVTATDPAPNHIRNIEIIRNDWIDGYDAGDRWNPDFISFHENMGYVRFMDWQETNGSPQVAWTDRATERMTYADSGFTDVGVPLEVCIDLCNRLQTAGWFCIPHQATDDYVEQMATLIRDTLDPALPAYFEYSNETWNGSFDVHDYCTSRGRADWPGAAGESSFTVALNWAGKRMSQCFQIVNTVFSAAPERAKNVLGAQIGLSGWGTKQVAEAPLWLEQEPGSYVKPAEVAEHVAVTCYFGSGMAGNAQFVTDVEAAYPATSNEVIQGYLTDPASSLTTLPEWRDEILADSAEAVKHGLTLLLYEGGNHIVMNNAYSDTIEAAVLQHHKSALEADNYEYLWNVWRNEVASGGPFSLYTDIGVWGGFGYWSLAEYPTQAPYPFLARIYELSAAEGPWWVDTENVFARVSAQSVSVRTFEPRAELAGGIVNVIARPAEASAAARTFRPTEPVTASAADWNVSSGNGKATVMAMPEEPEQPQVEAGNGTVTITSFSTPVPGMVENLTLEPGDTFVDVSWDAPSTGAAPTDYRWQVSNNGGATWSISDSYMGDTFTSYRQAGLTNGTSYTFRVAAINETGQGPWTEPMSATPVAA